MRSVWNGAISVAMLLLPVKLGSAVGSEDLELHQVRKSDGSRIRFKRVAKADGEEVAYSDIRKAWTGPDGNAVILTDDDFRVAYGERDREAKVLVFTDPTSIPELAASKPYLIQPTAGAERQYALLAGALRRAGKVAVVSFAMRQRENLGVVSEQDGYLLMRQLFWTEDIKRPDFEAPAPALSEAENSAADQLIEAMSGEFNHGEYHDESRAKLSELVRQRLESGQVTESATLHSEPEPSLGTDMLAAIQASVSAARAAREAS